MKKLLLTALLASLSAPSIAQSSGTEPSGPPRWSLGVGGIATKSPYAGEGTTFTPIPLVNYEGDRFFWRTTRAGVHLMKREDFEVSALVGMRMGGFDIDDLGSTLIVSSNWSAKARDGNGQPINVGGLATHAASPNLLKADYDPLKDFEPIGMIGSAPIIVITARSALACTRSPTPVSTPRGPRRSGWPMRCRPRCSAWTTTTPGSSP